ncbi:MAG: TraR/DksA C4-type zinc finger protein [Chloroflexi bacterium]|nr:TraR/DksA C4-type zinc finger protein [Chloroflexota bacterium]
MTNYQALQRRLDEEETRLGTELAHLRAAMEQLMEGAREIGGGGGPDPEEAAETVEMERSRAMERSLVTLLDQVHRALGKLASGTYGSCEECGQPINPERLEALPHASLCIDCRSRQDGIARGRR